MHIQSTRVARGRFRHHLTRTAQPAPVDPYESTGSRILHGHARERLEHLHADFELDSRYQRHDDVA